MSYPIQIIIYSIFFLFINLTFAKVDESDSSAVSQTQIELDEKKAESFDLSSYLFHFDPNLNVSLGVEINKGDTFLIIEMDHNPTRDEFMFRYDLIAPEFKAAVIKLENRPFGFHNKPVVRLPMIELEPSVTSSAKFIIDAKNQRTHQRVNLTKILRELEANGRLIDVEASRYQANDVSEITILATRPINPSSSVRTVYEIKIDFKKLAENKVHQIYGEQTLADISEQTEYQVGDEIKLKPNYKIPHRSSDTQWIINPELSVQDFLIYRLISNPKVGDLYTIPISAEKIDRVLPKIKPGNAWVKLSEDETSITYSLANETAKLSPNIILRYVKAMLISATNEEDNGGDAIAVMKKAILDVPINFQESRLENLFQVMLKATDINDMVRALMIEQNYSQVSGQNPELKKPENKNMCSGYLN